MPKQSFGDFITTRRRELDLTLGDVATGLGVSPITVSNWSNGQTTPDAEQLAALARLLEVPTDDLARMSGVSPGAAEPAVNLMPATPKDAGKEPEPAGEETTGPIAMLRTPQEAPETPAPEPAVQEDPVPVPDRTDQPDAMDSELAELIEEATAEPVSEARQAAPAPTGAAVATAERTPRKRPQLRRRRESPEQAVTAIPLTYVEDPKQLSRYRIRWALTTVALIVMFFILLWASGELLSALSEVKQAVTPGGLGS